MFEVRAGRDDDQPQIIELVKEVFGPEPAERTERRWHWQWHEDPRLGRPGYRGVVAEWNGEVIANLSSIPAGLHVHGEPLEAYWYADALVHWGKVRRALREQRRSGAAAEGPDLSRGIAIAMIDHPAAGLSQMAKHMTDPMVVVAHRVGGFDRKDTGSFARLVSFREPLQRYLGKPLGFLLGWLADWAIPRIPRLTLPVSLLEGDFDARFDALWSRAVAEYPAITRRDSVVLNWRYRRHPDTAYTVLTAEDESGLRGYLVYSTFHRHGQLRAQIVDVLVGRADATALDALLAAALQRLRAAAVYRVECYAGGTTLIGGLERAKFKPRLHDGMVQSTVIRRIPDVDLHVTRGDGDGG